MAEREVPRRLTQRHLEIPEPEGPSGQPEVPVEGPPEPRRAPALPPIPREPSDLKLRERQRRWLEERARFERARESDEAPSTSK